MPEHDCLEGRHEVSIPFWVFCVLRPKTTATLRAGSRGFNPVLGFLCSATCQRRLCWLLERPVSIPFWVFCVLRRTVSRLLRPLRSVSIPFWVFCVLRPQRSKDAGSRMDSFNPVLGFLCSATGSSEPYTRYATGCFNPVLGFLCSATRTNRSVGPSCRWFQSRSGFSVFCDRMVAYS